MLKSLLVVLVIACVAAAAFPLLQQKIADDECDYEYTCVNKGGKCTVDVLAIDREGVSFLVCPQSQYCSLMGICVDLVAIGGKCDDDVYCVTNATCHNGTCTAWLHGKEGDYCDDESDDDYYSCTSRLVCDDNKCRLPPQKGQRCDWDDECGSPYVCNRKVCIDTFSVSEGGSCDDDDSCAAGLYCSKSSHGVCKKPAASSNNSCTDDDDSKCRPDEECACSANSPDANMTCQAPGILAPEFTQAFVQLYPCYYQNNCEMDSDYALESCTACRAQLCAYSKAVMALLQYPSCLYPEFIADYPQLCSTAFILDDL